MEKITLWALSAVSIVLNFLQKHEFRVSTEWVESEVPRICFISIFWTFSLGESVTTVFHEAKKFDSLRKGYGNRASIYLEGTRKNRMQLPKIDELEWHSELQKNFFKKLNFFLKTFFHFDFWLIKIFAEKFFVFSRKQSF